MKKILIITYYFPPSGGSGVQRWLKFVKYLPQFGWQPIVLTVNPKKANFPHFDHSLEKNIPPEVRVEHTDTFEILDFYKKISAEKAAPSGNLTAEKYSSFPQKVFRFIRGNFLLPDPRRGWNKYAYRRACELIEKENIQHIVTTSPPHSTQLIGLRLKKKFPVLTWFADFRDPWTDVFYYKLLYPTRLADRVNKRYERKVLETADKVIVTHETTRNVFLSKSEKILPEKIAVITNGFDEDDFAAVKDNVLSRFTVTYIGILTNADDLKSLLSAFSKIENKENCLLRFVGQSGTVVASEIAKYSLEKYTEIVPQVSHSDVVQLMADSSVLLLLTPNESEASSVLPGKLFEYLAAHRPILCIASPDSDIRRIIAENSAGQSFDYQDETKMLHFLEKQKTDWETNKISRLTNTACLKYSRKNLTARLVELLSNVSLRA